VQRRIEEERRRKSWATAGYLYDHQQPIETAVRARTQEAMEVDALASAAVNGGVKREREEEDIVAKDSPSKSAKTVE